MFPVIEAVLVAIIILTAILFFTSVQRPTTAADSGGLDLGRMSADTLRILSTRTFEGKDLETWVTDVVGGNSTTAATVDAFLREVLDDSLAYSLRVTNGVGELQILPLDPSSQPHLARAAQMPFFPNWTAFADEGPGTMASPGQNVSSGPFASWISDAACIESPTGSDAAPADSTWAERWADSDPVVPAGSLYGTWAAYTDAGCSAGATYATIVRPGCEASADPECTSPYAMYGLQLVVWFGA